MRAHTSTSFQKTTEPSTQKQTASTGLLIQFSEFMKLKVVHVSEKEFRVKLQCWGKGDLFVLISPRPPIESGLGLESRVHILLAWVDQRVPCTTQKEIGHPEEEQERPRGCGAFSKYALPNWLLDQ